MPTAITIKKSKNGGFYVNDQIPIIHQGRLIDPQEFLLRVGSVKEGLVIPIDAGRPLLLKNIDGETFCAVIDPDNHMILTITCQSTGIEIDELEIDQESHFWFFAASLPAEQLLSKTPKQT